METNPNLNSSSSFPISSPSKPSKPLTTSPATEPPKTLSNHHHHHIKDEYWKKFPKGYRFCPHNGELIVHYLRKKVLNQPLPPNKIAQVNLYQHNPEVLAELFKNYKEDDAYYFFTPRDRKYRNGDRPSRAAGCGYWKATGASKEVRHQGVKVGSRNALVFYRGKPPNGAKTDWIMHEFTVENSRLTKRNGANDMRLDDWVLCKIYCKPRRSCKARNVVEEVEDRHNHHDHQADRNKSMTAVVAASTPCDENINIPQLTNTPSGGGEDIMVDVNDQIQASNGINKQQVESSESLFASSKLLFHQDDTSWNYISHQDNYGFGYDFGLHADLINNANNYTNPYINLDNNTLMSFHDYYDDNNNADKQPPFK
ncbi:hypothetical protein ACOSQ4_012822 [Xanthoceras sorbifolium]